MGRVAVVTGGTRGIGQAISVALKHKGFRVAANYAANDTAAHAVPAAAWPRINCNCSAAAFSSIDTPTRRAAATARKEAAV